MTLDAFASIDPLVVIATYALTALVVCVLFEHIPKWLNLLTSSKRFRNTRTWHDNRGLNLLAWLAAVLSPVYVILFLAVLWALWRIVTSFPEPVDGNSTNLRWHVLALVGLMTALAGLVATPLALIRVFTTERQTRAQEEGLITDRINSAVASLAAQKEVNKLGRNLIYEHDGQKKRGFQWYGEDFQLPQDEADSSLPIDQSDGEWKNVTLTEPNIEVRIGAILALERLARQRANDAKGVKARTDDGILDHDGARDHVRIMEVLCAYVRENAPAGSAKDRLWQEGEGTPKVEKWIETLPLPRMDIAVALNVLGRRTTVMRSCEGSQKSEELGSGDFRWHGYRMDLSNINLQGARLSNTEARRMDLSHTDFESSRLEGVYAPGIDLTECDLHDVRLDGASLSMSILNGAYLDEASLDGANLSLAKASGTHFGKTRMANVSLLGLRMNRATVFTPLTLFGSSIAHSTIWDKGVDPELLQLCFGDASVTFAGDWPKGTVIVDGGGIQRANTSGNLSNWASETLGGAQFEEQWRAFQASLGDPPEDQE